MLELPALAKTGNLNRVLDTIRDFNINIDGEYGKSTKMQNIFIKFLTDKQLELQKKKL